MKSYVLLLLILISLSVEQSFASSWLVSPARELNSEDKKQIKELLKYQEPLHIKKGSGTVTPTKPTTPTDTAALQKQVESVWTALQKKITNFSNSGKKSAYTAFIENIKDAQKSTTLTSWEKYILNSLLEKANTALKALGTTTSSSTGSTSSTGTTTVSGKKTIGDMTFSPTNFSTKSSSWEIILGKFSVPQNITLHHLDLTIRSDQAITLSDVSEYVLLEKDTGVAVMKTKNYKSSWSNTLQVFFDSAFLIRTGDYEVIANFKDQKNTYYRSYLDFVQTSRGSQTLSSESYMLSETTIIK